MCEKDEAGGRRTRNEKDEWMRTKKGEIRDRKSRSD